MMVMMMSSDDDDDDDDEVWQKSALSKFILMMILRITEVIMVTMNMIEISWCWWRPQLERGKGDREGRRDGGRRQRDGHSERDTHRERQNYEEKKMETDNMSVCVCLFVCPSVCLSVRLPICLPYLPAWFVCLSVCVNMSYWGKEMHRTISVWSCYTAASVGPPRWPSGKASASRAEDPGFESRLRRDFFGVESYQWLKSWHSSGYPAGPLAL